MNNPPNSTVNVMATQIRTTELQHSTKTFRSRAVRRLVSSVLIQSGVSPNRILFYQAAKIASNLNAEGKRQNRRAEITITPNG
jgi:hypothetical protein